MQIVNQENCNSLQPNNCSLDFALVFFVFLCLCTCLFRVFVLTFVLRFVRAFGNVLLGLYCGCIVRAVGNVLLRAGRMMVDQAALCIH